MIRDFHAAAVRLPRPRGTPCRPVGEIGGLHGRGNCSASASNRAGKSFGPRPFQILIARHGPMFGAGSCGPLPSGNTRTGRRLPVDLFPWSRRKGPTPFGLFTMSLGRLALRESASR